MKKILATLLLVVMVFSCSSLAGADSFQSFAVQTVHVEQNGEMNVIAFDPQEGQLQGKDFTIMLDQSAVTVDSISSLKSSNVGTTWLFVVDLSAGMLKNTQTILKGLIFGDGSVMSDKDNVGIFPTGMSEKDIQLTSNQQMLQNQIDGLKSDNKSKQLFAQIAAALKFLQTGKEVRDRTALVVISSGVNEDATGMSYEELIKNLENTKTTVYTFALLGTGRERKKLERYNAFARTSIGGQYYEVNDKNLESQVQDLIRNETLFRCLTANPSIKGITGKTVTVSRADNTKVLDSIDLTAGQQKLIKDAVPTPTPAPATTEPVTTAPVTEPPVTEPPVTEPPVTEPPATEPPVTPPVGLTPMQIGIIAAAAVLVILIIVLVSKKGKKKVEDTASEPTSSPYTEVPEKTEVAPQAPTVSTLMVKLDSVGLDEQKSYASPMVDELVIGRVPQKARLIVPDPKVSSANSKLTYENKVMFIEDMGSTNGTQLNGMKVTGKVVVHQQDIIRIGQTNLRISWERAK